MSGGFLFCYQPKVLIRLMLRLPAQSRFGIDRSHLVTFYLYLAYSKHPRRPKQSYIIKNFWEKPEKILLFCKVICVLYSFTSSYRTLRYFRKCSKVSLLIDTFFYLKPLL